MQTNKALGYAAGLVLAAAVSASSLTAQITSKTNLPASYRPEFGTMWTFDAPPLEYWKTRYNFTPDQKWLDNVRLASIRLPGCSASFVSENGLVMTNHHCARSCISAVSPPDTNYQHTGFVAATPNQEKKCPNVYVDRLVGVEDVTQRVQSNVTATVAAQRVAQREAEIARIQQECGTGGMTCQVVGFYQGGMYSLYRYRRYNDVRLVFAPEEEVSFFGGDPDNFTYPRYDLDVTLYRVYENDQPFRPENFLKWSTAGANEGDLVFVVGNPGSTGRLLTIAQMEFLRDVTYPAQLAQLNRSIKIYEDLSARSEAAKRQHANALFGTQNSFKAITGYLSGLTSAEIMAQKRAFETDFRARINADQKLSAQFGTTWAEIEAAQNELKSIALQSRYYPFSATNLSNIAGLIVRLPAQAALADSLRLPAWRTTGLERIRGQLLNPNLPIDTAFERAALAGWLTAAQQELDPKDPVLVAILAGRSPEQAAADLVKGTQLGSGDFRKTLIEGGAASVAAADDPLIVLARALEPRSLPVAERVTRLNNTISANAEKIGQAIFAAYGKSLPPDATFTLRISDGEVAGYPMNGTIAPFRTSFYGLYARHAEFDGRPPFELPKRWLDKLSALDLSTPLNFVSTNDIIGGNSGSPVINRNGEVVGLIFDGNIESLPNRFIFTDAVARSVSVHSRAIPEAIRKVFDAPQLADELEGK